MTRHQHEWLALLRGDCTDTDTGDAARLHSDDGADIAWSAAHEIRTPWARV